MDEHMTDTEDEYDDLEYNDEFESILQAAESQVGIPITSTNAPLCTDPAAQPGSSAVDAWNDDGQHLPIQQEAQPRMEFEIGMEELIDIEDTPVVSPFERFRQHGKLSVSDLVGTVWCEVQYDYRLRTLPYLPPSKRPAVITSDKGKEIVVDKTKEEGRERIVRRGEKIHKRLEREIHPQEVVVTTDSREDVWGLRFLNMLAAMEALITLGTCREVPVVGFVGGILVTGIIASDLKSLVILVLCADKQDELNRRPINKSTQAQTPQTRSSRQPALTSFFSPTKPRRSSPEPKARTHKVYVSDCKTRARDSLPRESDTLAGQLQCMMYKELLDAMFLAKTSDGLQEPTSLSIETNRGMTMDLEDAAIGVEVSASGRSLRPSANPLSFEALFQYLALEPAAPFSEHFIAQTRPIIIGNGLRLGAAEARNLTDMVLAWERYVADLGLGSQGSKIPPSSSQSKPKGRKKADSVLDENAGKTEMRLELVYRRAGPKKVESKKKGGKGRRRKKGQKGMDAGGEDDATEEAEVEEVEETMEVDYMQGDQAREEEEERMLQMAIQESLKGAAAPGEAANEDDDLSGPTVRADRSEATPSKIGVSALTAKPQSTDNHIVEAQQRADHVRPTSRLCEYHIDRTSDEEREEDELAWAVEMSLAEAQEDDTPGEIAVPLSQRSAPSSPVKQTNNDLAISIEDTRSTHSRSSSSSPTPLPGTSTASGSIIGRHRFKHDIPLLDRHLESVLQYWKGEREPVGVSLMETRRCGWCEFEEGCEWRAKKAQEEWERSRSSRKI